jgi:phage-related protein
VADLAVAVQFSAETAQAVRGIESVGDSLEGLERKAQSPLGAIGKLTTGLGAFGLAKQGVDVVIGAAQGLAGSFTGPAIEMENARAKLNAFTKDSTETEKILAAVRAEADKTPFSFGEMAQAAGSLAPLAKRAGVDLTGLLQAAEALSASDPMQGFEGAVVALREAVSGDLMSLRERFEIDTRGMAAAIESGVPPVEAVTQGLADLGINLDLVRGLANTTTGRMSTFQDTLEGIRRVAGEEILKGFGTQLDNMSAFIQDNQEELKEFARLLGQGVAAAMELAGAAFAAVMPLIRQLVVDLGQHLPAASEALRGAVMAVVPVVQFLGETIRNIYVAAQPVLQVIGQNLQPLFIGLAAVLATTVVPAFALWAGAAATAAVGTMLALAPVVLPLAAIGLAVAGLAKLWTDNFFGIQEKTAAVWTFLSEQVFAPLAETFRVFTAEISPEVQKAWQNITKIAQEAWQGFMNFFTPIWEGFKKDWAIAWPVIQKILEGAWEAIKLAVRVGWEIISTIIKTGLKILQGDWAGAWEEVKGGLVRAWEDIKGTIGGGLQQIAEMFVGFASQAWEHAKNVGLKFVEGLVNGLREALSQIKIDVGPFHLSASGFTIDPPPMPTISLPSFGGPSPTTPSRPSTGGSAGGGWFQGKFYETEAALNQAKRDAGTGGVGGGPPVIGGDLAAKGENAIAWALNKLGSQDWNWLCQRFVEMAFGTSGKYPSAWSAAQALMTNRGGNPPRNSLVFFRPDSTNANFGHVGISLGDNRFISATANGVRIDDLNSGYWGNLFAGYGPPRFRRGVKNFSGGWAVVGEGGPEVLRLPRGTDVLTNSESRGRGMLGGGNIHIHFHRDVYGFQSFEDAVATAVERARRTGLEI